MAKCSKEYRIHYLCLISLQKKKSAVIIGRPSAKKGRERGGGQQKKKCCVGDFVVEDDGGRLIVCHQVGRKRKRGAYRGDGHPLRKDKRKTRPQLSFDEKKRLRSFCDPGGKGAPEYLRLTK